MGRGRIALGDAKHVKRNPGEGLCSLDGPYTLTPTLSPQERGPTSSDDPSQPSHRTMGTNCALQLSPPKGARNLYSAITHRMRRLPRIAALPNIRRNRTRLKTILPRDFRERTGGG